MADIKEESKETFQEFSNRLDNQIKDFIYSLLDEVPSENILHPINSIQLNK